MKGRLFIVVLVAAVVAGVASVGAAGAPTAQAQRVASLEQPILHELNAVRAAHGLRPLRVSPGLRTAAVGHSRAMLTGGFFAHTSRDGSSFSERIRRSYGPTGFAAWSVGENLLFTSVAIEPSAALAAWMASPPHRRNILSPVWREVGIAVLRSPSAGGTFRGGHAWVVTMDFGSRDVQQPSA